MNPAFSFGAFIAGHMPLSIMLQFWAAQFIGAVVATGVLYLIASGTAGYNLAGNGLGQNG